jgi:hypothetical protein
VSEVKGEYLVIDREGARVEARSEPHGSAHGWTDETNVPTEAVVKAVADMGLEYVLTVHFKPEQLADVELAAAWKQANEALGVIWKKLDEAREKMKP